MFIYLFFIFSISLFLFCFKEIGFSFRKKTNDEIAMEESVIFGDRAKLDYDIRYLLWQVSSYILLFSTILLFVKK